MHDMKPTTTRRSKPRIKSKNKSYSLKDSALYNITTKKRLVNLLEMPINKLEELSVDDNYRVFSLEKEGKKPREIQAPIYELDVVQTRIASLLVRVATPDYLHSGVKGRSNITNAAVHVGDHPVLTMDIQNYYPSVTKKAIYNFFHSTMRASPDVAEVLAKLCTYDDHIPTGSRLSMPLSFWANQPMCSRLYSLCQGKSVKMSLFVDDLTFSGLNVNQLFKKNVENIIECAGLSIHPEKTKLYKRNQPKIITGAVVDHSGVKVRNKHHKAIYMLYSEIRSCSNDDQLKVLQEKLVGSLNAAGQIEPAFKQRAKQLMI